MITAKLTYLRISPRKVRLVANLVKGLDVEEAEKQLKFLTQRAARPILKLLNSAVANAQHNANLAKESLYVVNVIVEPGPSLKRWRPRAMGRATPIMKRTSHLTVLLDQKEPRAGSSLEKTVSPESAEEKEKTMVLKEVQKVAEEKRPSVKPRPVVPARPYPTSSQAKKRFFNRQTFGNVKKYFRRKSI